MKKPKGPKAVSYELIPQDSEIGRVMYERLYMLIDEHHDALRDAKIALAWNTSWQPDVDGRVTLGKCKKSSDLDRELAPYDFVIILRREFWENTRVSDLQRTALLDHELCHAAVKYDERGDPVIDQRGRTVYRIRKHDLEEFSDIAARYGCWKRDLEYFAAALRRAAQPELALTDAADQFMAGQPDGTTCTLQAFENGKPLGEAVEITPEMSAAARERIAGRTTAH